MSKIRIAKIEDLNEIMEVINDTDLPQREESKPKIEERIKSNQLLIYTSDDKIIGFLGWQSGYQGNQECWYLEQITIHKDHRGKGIGKDFMNYFLQLCRDSKVKKLYAHIQSHNERSLRMFLSVDCTINSDADKSIPNEITVEFDIDKLCYLS